MIYWEKQCRNNIHSEIASKFDKQWHVTATIQMGIKLGSVVCIPLVLTAAPLEQVKPNCRRNNQEAQSLTLKVLYSMWKKSKEPE